MTENSAAIQENRFNKLIKEKGSGNQFCDSCYSVMDAVASLSDNPDYPLVCCSATSHIHTHIHTQRVPFGGW